VPSSSTTLGSDRFTAASSSLPLTSFAPVADLTGLAQPVRAENEPSE
jgi:hypothetical protein